MIVLYAVIGEGKLLIPLDMQDVQTRQEEEGKEQPELVLDMVRDLKTRCLAKGVDSRFIVMDSWYCSTDMLDKISESGFIVVIEGKSNVLYGYTGKPSKVQCIMVIRSGKMARR